MGPSQHCECRAHPSVATRPASRPRGAGLPWAPTQHALATSRGNLTLWVQSVHGGEGQGDDGHPILHPVQGLRSLRHCEVGEGGTACAQHTDPLILSKLEPRGYECAAECSAVCDQRREEAVLLSLAQRGRLYGTLARPGQHSGSGIPRGDPPGATTNIAAKRCDPPAPRNAGPCDARFRAWARPMPCIHYFWTSQHACRSIKALQGAGPELGAQQEAQPLGGAAAWWAGAPPCRETRCSACQIRASRFHRKASLPPTDLVPDG